MDLGDLARRLGLEAREVERVGVGMRRSRHLPQAEHPGIGLIARQRVQQEQIGLGLIHQDRLIQVIANIHHIWRVHDLLRALRKGRAATAPAVNDVSIE